MISRVASSSRPAGDDRRPSITSESDWRVRIDAGTLFDMGCLLAGAGSHRRRFASPQRGCIPTKFSSKIRPSPPMGTLFGGWRIVRTMGSRITRLTPMQGFCAETAGAATLFLATWLGVPVSTTHTITGAIIGVGAARRLSAVRWNVTNGIVFAWVVTIPAAGIVAALFYEMARLFSW